jgi:3-phenylpropionate/trans-cinnamate dioxygenase ferredoxin reductase subunit
LTVPGRVVVVGASAAGLACAEGLRRMGFHGPLTLVGDEAHLPYDRPPLSKQLLSGAWGQERLRLRSAEELVPLDLDLRLGSPAVALDPKVREVVLGDGTPVGYDTLVVATGVRPRRLPGTEGIAGVHVLRTLEDALAVRAVLAAGRSLVVVGGGFIGAEAAAVARELGCEVTLVTDQQVPLADAVGTEVGAMLADLHRDHGVNIVTGTAVEGVLAENGRVTGIRLADGGTIAATAVLVGIGTRPNIEWLAGSGLPLGNGIECDATLYAGDGVWAAGDVASWPEPVSGERRRIEHRTNAAEQALAIARNILAPPGEARALTTVPYVWSDQYDRKIQIYGRSRGADQVRIIDGNLAERRFTALYGREGRVVAALGINLVRPLRALRRLVADRTPWDEALAAAAP